MRQALKRDARVLSQLDTFWRVYAKDRSGRVTKAEYLRVHAKFCMTLIPDITYEEAARAGEEDWATDSHGSAALSKSAIRNCLFELADLWCVGVSAEEYALFLHKL